MATLLFGQMGLIFVPIFCTKWGKVLKLNQRRYQRECAEKYLSGKGLKQEFNHLRISFDECPKRTLENSPGDCFLGEQVSLANRPEGGVSEDQKFAAKPTPAKTNSSGCFGIKGFKMSKLKIKLQKDKIESFCRKHHIAYLALFGSVLTSHFTERSDVDVLVKFQKKHTPHIFSMIGMESELSDLIGYQVDLKTPKDLSRYFRDDVLAKAKKIYGK